MEDQINKRGLLDILLEELEDCTDYRESSRVLYSLTEVLFLAFCGLLSGCESYEDISDFGKMKQTWLQKYLPYTNGIPSHDTINRAMSLLNIKELENVLLGISSYEIKLKTGDVLHIDGKAIAGSATKKEIQTKKINGGRQALYTVNVFSSSVKSCLASMKVADKGGEKQVLIDLLDVLDMRGCLITLDANFCFKDVTEQLENHEVDYLIGLKKNQPILYKKASELLEEEALCHEKDLGYEEKSHGRIEKRDCFVINLSQLTQDQKDKYSSLFSEWKGLKSLIKIKSNRTIISTNKTTEEIRYYILSKELNALEVNKLVRNHWSIENNLHWVLDTALGEDRSKKRNENAAFAFSIFRKIALNKLVNFPDLKTSIKRKARKCAMSEDYLSKVLFFTNVDN